MIHRIYSDLEGFRNLQLVPGLNVLLADKSEEATDKQTRNGAGKTSLIELIHFILGGNVKPDSIFRSKELATWRFGMDFDLAGDRVAIERLGAASGNVVVKTGDVSNWSIQPTLDKNSGEMIVSNSKWKSVLGELVFGLPVDEADERGKFARRFVLCFRISFGDKTLAASSPTPHSLPSSFPGTSMWPLATCLGSIGLSRRASRNSASRRKRLRN